MVEAATYARSPAFSSPHPPSPTACELPTLWPVKLDEHSLRTFKHQIIDIHDARGYELVVACLVEGRTAAVGFKLIPDARPPYDVDFQMARGTASLRHARRYIA